MSRRAHAEPEPASRLQAERRRGARSPGVLGGHAPAHETLQARLDDSPRVQRLRALGAPIAQRMVLNLDPGDQKITKDATNIGTAGGGTVVTGWGAVAGIGDGETLHVVAHLEGDKMGADDPEALAARAATALQGKQGVSVDLHGCFAANPRALGAGSEGPGDLWASYAGRFQRELSALFGAQVPVSASLGAEYTNDSGVTRVRSPRETQQTLNERVDHEALTIGGQASTRNARATNAIIAGTRAPGFFLGADEGRVVFKDHGADDDVARADGGTWEDADADGPWDANAYELQAKLEVGAADDAYEREADRMARHAIARMYAPESAARDEGEVTPAGDPVQTKATPLRRHGGDGAFDAPDHVEAGIAASRGGGSPLPAALRAPLEGSLGADFSRVRVHSDARSHALNESIQAKAFTTGQDVFFGQGAYQPGSRGGQELLAHELTHVVQQGGADVARRPEEERIQRLPAWKNQKDDSYDALVAELDKLVNVNASYIEADPLGIPIEQDGYVERWNEVIASYAAKLNETSDPEAAFAEEPFIYAAFGYAVESLTNWQIATGALAGVLPKDTRPKLQATRGHTRPDLVIQNGVGQDLAWFDITASASETHIDRKSGSGWSTMEWVAEVTYPSLTTKALVAMASFVLSGKKGKGKSLGDLAGRVKAHREKQALQIGSAYSSVNLALEAAKDKHPTNAAKRRGRFVETLREVLKFPELSPAVAKGLLRLLAGRGFFTSYSKVAADAGFTAFGGSGSPSGPDTETAKELVYNL